MRLSEGRSKMIAAQTKTHLMLIYVTIHPNSGGIQVLPLTRVSDGDVKMPVR